MAWALLLGAVAIAVVIAFLPAWIIQPFRPQTSGGVALALALRRVSPILTIALALAALGAVVALWRGGRWWVRVLVVLLVIPATLSAWFARQNHFEWMFHPLPHPQ